jgi:hypothetical protein
MDIDEPSLKEQLAETKADLARLDSNPEDLPVWMNSARTRVRIEAHIAALKLRIKTLEDRGDYEVDPTGETLKCIDCGQIVNDGTQCEWCAAKDGYDVN